MAKLLLVDDEKEILEALELILSAEGHQISALRSAAAALETLLTGKENKPDLLIADIVMPKMSGLELMAALRADPDYSTLPILFISASVSPEVETEIAQMEQVKFLRKPFEIDELCSLIGTLAGNR